MASRGLLTHPSATAPIRSREGQLPGRPDFRRLVYCLMGIPVDAISLKQAVYRLQCAARRHTRCFLSTPNLNFLIASRNDRAFRDSVIRSDLTVADGMPLIWMARLLGLPFSERVAGSTLFERMARSDGDAAVRVFFFGGPQGAAGSAAAAVNAHATGVRCVGFSSPGFGSVEEMSAPGIIGAINQVHPDFLVVALGAKKGQCWIEHNLAALAAPIVSHLGAVVNMAAGRISRAPGWMQRSGMEWLWRIKEEPGLWKRYVVDAFALAQLVVTRLVPAVYYERIYRKRVGALHGTVRIERSYECCKIVLSGAWTDAGLQALRVALDEATIIPCDILVDMQGVTYGDSAFIGLLMMVYGHQTRVRWRLKLIGVSPLMRRILRAHCSDYLMDE